MREIMLLIIIGLCSGMLGGMTGLGGGIIIVPMLVFFFGFSQLQAQGTSTATLLFPIGILSAINYYNKGNVNWKFAIIMAITFVIGAYFGSKWALSIDEKNVKRIFGSLMLVVAIQMLYKTFKT